MSGDPHHRPRVVLIGPRRLYLEALCDYLEGVAGVAASLVASSESKVELGPPAPDVVVLDCSLDANVLEGLAMSIRESESPARVMLLTSGPERDNSEKIAALGAAGAASLTQAALALVESICELAAPVNNGAGRLRGCRETSTTSFEWPLSSLTEREMSVLELLVSGHSNEETSQALGISPHTVRTHVQNVMAKLVVRSRTEMVNVAVRCGLPPRKVGTSG